MAALKAMTRVPAGRCTAGQASGGPRQSGAVGIAPLGRYRTIPGALKQLYSNSMIQTVDLRHVGCRRWARLL